MNESSFEAQWNGIRDAIEDFCDNNPAIEFTSPAHVVLGDFNLEDVSIRVAIDDIEGVLKGESRYGIDYLNRFGTDDSTYRQQLLDTVQFLHWLLTTPEDARTWYMEDAIDQLLNS